MATDRPRYTVSVDPELFQRIEDFRFQHRFQTRSRATEELIRKGLEQAEREEKEGGEYPPPIVKPRPAAQPQSGGTPAIRPADTHFAPISVRTAMGAKCATV